MRYKSLGYCLLFVTILMTGSISTVIGYQIEQEYTKSDGTISSFDEEYSGQYILLDSMATWCGPCRVEMIHLQEVYEETKDNPNVTIVTMSMDPETDTISKVGQFMEEFDAEWDYALDHNRSIGDQLDVRGYPTTFFLDPEGNILKKWEGVTEPDVILKEMDKHLDLPGEFVRSLNLDALFGNLINSPFFYIFMVMVWLFIFYSGYIFIEKMKTPTQDDQTINDDQKLKD